MSRPAAVELPSAARVHVEEHAGRHDDLLLEQFPEEAPAVVQRGWQIRDVAPAIEGALRWMLHGDTHVLPENDFGSRHKPS